MKPDADDKQQKIKKGCTSAVIVLAVFLFMLLFIPRELGWVFLLICAVIEGWILTRIAKSGMEKKLGRKLKGKHELTSITSWMEASDGEDAEQERRRRNRERREEENADRKERIRNARELKRKDRET